MANVPPPADQPHVQHSWLSIVSAFPDVKIYKLSSVQKRIFPEDIHVTAARVSWFKENCVSVVAAYINHTQNFILSHTACVYIYTYISAYIHTNIPHIHTYNIILVHQYIHIRIYIYVQVQIYVSTCLHTCRHTYIYICTYT